jgi:Tol biopolymer transport system component
MRTLLLALAIAALAAAPAHATYAGRNGRIVVSSNRSGSWQLHSLNADGSGIRQITALPAADPGDPANAFLPDVSPDGRRVAFISHQNTSLSNAVYGMRIDGSGITRLTNSFPLHDVQPVYSPDGKRIAFVSDRRSGAAEHDQDLYVMDADGSHVTRIAADLTVGGCPDDDNCVNPDWGAAP